MEQISSQIGNWIKYIKEKIEPLTNENFQFVELQRNIFYFSKFTIEIDEFKEIFSMIKTIKENVFKNVINKIKLGLTSAVTFIESSLSDKDKGLTLFSVCYLHYYYSFAYDTSNSFANYYNEEFFSLCQKFRFTVRNADIFKAFCFEFYNEMQIQIKKLNYDKIKNFYQYYNSYIIDDHKSDFSISHNNPIELLKKHLNKKEPLKKKCILRNTKLLTHLVAAKERMVDMVLENRTKRFFNNNVTIQKSINELIDQIHTISKETYVYTDDHTLIDNKNFNNNHYNHNNNSSITNTEDNKNSLLTSSSKTDDNNKMIIDDESSLTNNTSNNNSIINSDANSFYSKRVLSELIKCEIDDNIKAQVNEISQKVDDLFLDVLLNQNEKTTNMINPFVCYIIEINSDIIKLISEYSTIQNDLILRFIVPAKNLYNIYAEIYFSIYDLKETGIETVTNILIKRNISLKLATSVYSFIKGMTYEMFKEKTNIMDKMDTVFESFFNEQFKVWESTIKEKGQELTHFCLV